MPIIELWLAISSQWRAEALVDGRLHYFGLDYAAVNAGLERAGMATTPATWAGIQVMERVASAALNGVRG